jgi:hypothetical protein
LPPTLGDDVPMSGLGLATLLLFKKDQPEASEQRDESRRVAIEMRMAAFPSVADEADSAISLKPD